MERAELIKYRSIFITKARVLQTQISNDYIFIKPLKLETKNFDIVELKYYLGNLADDYSKKISLGEDLLNNINALSRKPILNYKARREIEGFSTHLNEL